MRDPILRIKDVMQITTLSRTTLYRLMGRGDFPPPLKLGPNARGWRRSEVEAWVENRDRSDIGASASTPVKSVD